MNKYTYAVGRRKSATAQVLLYKWEWKSIVNWKNVSEYVNRSDLFDSLYQSLKVCWVKDSFYFEANVKWSWESSQVGAISLWIARALAESDEWYKKALKSEWLLTRDARKVERKKPWKHKARKSLQWSKR